MIRTIAVLGAGTMGHGIAQAFALKGYPVTLFDPDATALTGAMQLIAEELDLLAEEGFIDKAVIEPALARVTVVTDLATAVGDRDYVIEATPERMDLKQQLFRQLDGLCPPHTIFASNTSSLPLEGMSALLGEARKARIMVNHWYNPAHVMPLVELSFFGNMPADLYAEVEALYRAIGKQTAKILKDVPGLVANRIQQGVAREVFSLIEQGVAEPADIDKALKFGPAFRYATTGQLEVADFGGLDIWCAVADNLLKAMDNSQQANPLLRRKVADGKLGTKSGEGFFPYPADQVADIRKRFLRKLIHQLKASQYYI
jgi:3-hydroxybutyryl-CoA dehydrogenase